MKDIFSGDYSVKMWNEINAASDVSELRMALYFVCCRLQEFESAVHRGFAAQKEPEPVVGVKCPVVGVKCLVCDLEKSYGVFLPHASFYSTQWLCGDCISKHVDNLLDILIAARTGRVLHEE